MNILGAGGSKSMGLHLPAPFTLYEGHVTVTVQPPFASEVENSITVENQIDHET